MQSISSNAGLFGQIEVSVPAVVVSSDAETTPRKPRFKPINRAQMMMRTINIERLVERDHPVRAIWDMMGQVDLSEFDQNIRAVEGHPGQATVSTRLLASLWTYAYAEGVSSARELSRMCDYDAGCQWLTGMETINHPTLSDFRVQSNKALERLFIEVLGVMSAEGLVELKQVMQDGTKVKANAGKDTFRREERLAQHLELAKKQLESMGDPRSDAISQRVAKAQERAVQEKKQRLEQAMAELQKVRQGKKSEERQKARVSTTDAEARIMKNSAGGYEPAYNVQIATDGAHGVILNVAAVQAANDWDQLVPAVERVEATVGKPEQIIVDAGYTSHENIEAMGEREVGIVGPPPVKAPDPHRYTQRGITRDFQVDAFEFDAEANHYVCPAGKILKFTTKEQHAGRIRSKYQAKPSECRECRFRDQCCPKTKSRRITRSEDSARVQAFHAEMQTAEAKEMYRRRPQVAEFVNAWIKDKIGLRQFRLRGLVKVQAECLWATVTYNIQQWMRLSWRPRLAAI